MEIKTEYEQNEKATIKVVFKSGNIVKINLEERKLEWIQMYFQKTLIPNPNTFGKVAEKIYKRNEETSIALGYEEG